ncbi:TspO/MBR family protein [Clostridium pasteurianum]|uniref:Tryptophan-rich sensory protein n=1 Tax=Clostridium pasteurianum BC1 TaxID=86416 RepID=R4K0I2_CLOPA|nr:TspO/MBR family protein [Clostridium pasteurianum]AGK96592.1 tryptophan-rich sensory protein [Clostridium pasteurianum BC1]
MVNIFKVNDKSEIFKAFFSIIIAEAVGALSAFLGGVNSSSYEVLKKPIIAPPAYVFPIVWPILYLLMGLAAYRIWETGKQGKNIRKALLFYVFQLLFNFLWAILFFRLRLYGLAFVELLILFIFIMSTTFEFFKYDRFSGLLMIPYIAGVSFAAVLNFAIWFLNC